MADVKGTYLSATQFYYAGRMAGDSSAIYQSTESGAVQPYFTSLLLPKGGHFPIAQSQPAVGPTTSGWTPSAGAIASTQTIQLDITSTAGVTQIFVRVQWANRGFGEPVYQGIGTGFNNKYSAGSSITSITNGQRLVCIRTGNWPDDFTMYVLAVNSFGNYATASQAYTISSGTRGVILPIPGQSQSVR